MKNLIFLVLFLGLFPTLSRSQDSTDVTKLEKIAWVTGATAFFGLFDYVGYNLVRGKYHGAPVWYRMLQGTVHAGISYLLYDQLGLSSAVAFNLMWWTWSADLGYYGWAYVFNPAHDDANNRWENRRINGLRDPITWAGWTPLGLTRPQGSVIALDALLLQSAIGLTISFTIL